jgi:hypothetical protein
MATGAVVGLVVGVADALLFAASRAQLAVTAVNGHLFAESRGLFGEAAVNFCVQAVDPELKRAQASTSTPSARDWAMDQNRNYIQMTLGFIPHMYSALILPEDHC